jgi:phage gp36-like protein
MAYITRTDLETFFGEENIAGWANIDATNNASTETDITNRVNAAISWAEAEFENRLRGSRYAVPISSADATVKQLLVMMAGEYLYGMRGMMQVEQSQAFGRMMKRVDQEIQKIVTGVKRLDLTLSHDGPTCPVVITDE